MHDASQRVAAQYERHIYPPPLEDLAGKAARDKTERGVNSPAVFYRRMWRLGHLFYRTT
jgi:hypothetical protein